MQFEQYHQWTNETAQYPTEPDFVGLAYVSLGLNGEVGELADIMFGLSAKAGAISNQVKKIARDDHDQLAPARSEKIIDELGDVFWYLSQLCHRLNVSPSRVMQINQSKLMERKRDGSLHGDRRESTPVDASKFAECPKGCGRHCPAGIVCCHECQTNFIPRHTDNCDARQLWFEKYRDSIMADVSLPLPSPAAGPTTEGVGDSSVGAPGKGGGERRRGDQGKLTPDQQLTPLSEEDFVEAAVGMEGFTLVPRSYYVALIPSHGPLARCKIVRQFCVTDSVKAADEAYKKYGGESTIVGIYEDGRLAYASFEANGYSGGVQE